MSLRFKKPGCRKFSFQMEHYRIFRMDRPSRGGGLLLLVSSRFCHKARLVFQRVDAHCEIQAVDLSVPGFHPITVANVYFPSGVHDTRPLDSLLSVSRSHVLLVGDFNSHHLTWGYRTDQCGLRLWDWACVNNLNCHNSGFPTFLRGHSRSALDLTFSSPGVALSSWTPVDSATNSDHFPLTFDIVCPMTSIGGFSCTLVDYNKFKSSLSSELHSLPNLSQESRVLGLCSILDRVRRQSEFTVCDSIGTSQSPWWNAECSKDYRRRKAAWKKLIHNQCPRNCIDYKFLAATFKRTVARAKEKYDEENYDHLSKSNNRQALFRFLRSRNRLPPPNNIPSNVLTPIELARSLEEIGKGLEHRFSAALSRPQLLGNHYDDFLNVSVSELSQVIHRLPSAAPGPDRVTSAMIKILFDESPNAILELVNYSIRTP